MEVWKIVFHFILEIFHSTPFWHLPYSIPKFPFRSIFHSISHHALVVDYLLLLLHFTQTVVASLKIRKRLILKKLLPLPAPFQHLRFQVRFRFQSLSSKCFRFHKKSTAFTTSSFRFHIPDQDARNLLLTIPIRNILPLPKYSKFNVDDDMLLHCISCYRTASHTITVGQSELFLLR